MCAQKQMNLSLLNVLILASLRLASAFILLWDARTGDIGMLKSIVADVGAEPVELGGQDSRSRCVKMRNHQNSNGQLKCKAYKSEVPMISKVQKSVDVPQIEYEDKVVEVPIQKPVPLAAEIEPDLGQSSSQNVAQSIDSFSEPKKG